MSTPAPPRSKLPLIFGLLLLALLVPALAVSIEGFYLDARLAPAIARAQPVKATILDVAFVERPIPLSTATQSHAEATYSYEFEGRTYRSDRVYAAEHHHPRGPGVRELHDALGDRDPNRYGLVAYVDPLDPGRAFLVHNTGRTPGSGWIAPWWASGLFSCGVTSLGLAMVLVRLRRWWRLARPASTRTGSG